jgi:sugar lactone lactonase YvrE
LWIVLFNACSSKPDSTVITKSVFTDGIEGPYAIDNRNILAVNYQKQGTIGCITPNEEGGILFELPGNGIGNSIQPLGDTAIIIADYVNHKIWMYHLEKAWTKVLADEPKMNQPNDLTVHPSGWIYASDPSWADSTGQLWLVTLDGKTKILEDKMGTTNGITLNNAGTILYVNESIQRNIWKYDIRKDGTLKNKKLFAQFEKAGLDGMKVGKNDELIVTRYDAGEIVVFNTSGALIKSYKLHGSKPTNLCFNEDSSKIFITLQEKQWMEEIVLEH